MRRKRRKWMALVLALVSGGAAGYLALGYMNKPLSPRSASASAATQIVVAARDLAPGFEIFNLGGAETTSLLDLVHWIAEELGVEPKIDPLPEQPGDVPITFADVQKAQRMLGYSPKVHIREGLKRFVRWYRESRD